LDQKILSVRRDQRYRQKPACFIANGKNSVF